MNRGKDKQPGRNGINGNLFLSSGKVVYCNKME